MAHDSKSPGVVKGKGRSSALWEAVRASFGFLSAIAMLTGVVLGFSIPLIDDSLNVSLPILEFDGQSSARRAMDDGASIRGNGRRRVRSADRA